MAQRVTLSELEAVADPLVTSTDFLSLANRAVKRLYAKAATPSDSVIYRFGSTSVSQPLHDVDAGGEDYPSHILKLPDDYSHALKFKVVSGAAVDFDFSDIVNSESLPVIPLESIFGSNGYDDRAFVDYGEDSVLGGRIYAIPQAYWDRFDDGTLSETNVYALVRRAYVDVVSDSDEFPFDNVGALKLAVLATEYEDENDLERASSYWSMAMSELEEESGRFRGPQKLNIHYYDPAAEEVTNMIN